MYTANRSSENARDAPRWAASSKTDDKDKLQYYYLALRTSANAGNQRTRQFGSGWMPWRVTGRPFATRRPGAGPHSLLAPMQGRECRHSRLLPSSVSCKPRPRAPYHRLPSPKSHAEIVAHAVSLPPGQHCCAIRLLPTRLPTYLPWVAYKAKRQTCPFGSLGSQVLAPDSRPHPCRKSGEAAFLTAVIFGMHVHSYEDGW